MNMKSVLLGTAAGMMIASGAYAADLPGEAAPAAVDYVKVCDAFGAGFFYIPGSDTCLKIKGRVRFKVQYNGIDGGNDNVNFRTDALVGFDARTATDYGTLRTYIEFVNDNGDGNGDRNVQVTQAFIQLGYVTVGRQDDVADGDGLYGVNDATWAPGDYTASGITVLADNLGGGFYAGVGLYGNDSNVTRQNVWTEHAGADVHVSAAVGLADQPWGSVDLSGVYINDSNGSLSDGHLWGVKGTADLKLLDPLTLRLWAAYTKTNAAWGPIMGTSDNDTTLALAAQYAVSDSTSLYAGVRYDILKGPDNTYANVGVDYTVVKGLDLQGEVDYNHYDSASDFAVLGRVVRVW